MGWAFHLWKHNESLHTEEETDYVFSVTGLPPNANLPDLKDSDRQPQWDSRKAGAFQVGRQWLPDEEAPWES